MCGIAGIIDSSNSKDIININDILEILSSNIIHRGPNHTGAYQNQNHGIVNTRLSIIDLDNGNQPFYSNDKKIAVVQNGEIYNFIEVRNELIALGVTFDSHSDTEVILRAYEHYGKDFIKKLNGMFAIAIIDETHDKLFLYRDRLGVKPLYIYNKDNILLFSSEIKSFPKLTFFDKTLNQNSIYHYFHFNYIPLPGTIFKYINHLEPGHYREISLDNCNIQKDVQYWSITNTTENRNFKKEDLLENIDELFNDALKIRLRSDVGIGAFLSGGLDSSLVCAVAAKNFNQKLETFSIGFHEKKFDESTYAKRVSELFELQNNILFMDSHNVNLWNKTTYHNDQPHGDISFIPTFLISKFASEKYKVVMTGDGGDELFGGYTKYLSLAEEGFDTNSYFQNISLIHEGSEIESDLFNKKWLNNFPPNFSKCKYMEVIGLFSEKDKVNQALLFDTLQLLPGNNLVKPDKMGMAHSLEARSPLLDYRLYELLSQVPGSQKISANKETKFIMKEYAKKYLPQDIIYRQKQMFTVPIGEWFKTFLKDYLTSTINSENIKNLNIFNENILSQMADDHISGKTNYTRELRAICNLDIWLKEFGI